MMKMSKEYFTLNHSYMNFDNRNLAKYVFDKITGSVEIDRESVAYEFGAGMGRFSTPIVNLFKKVNIIEPARDYADILFKKFKFYPYGNISIYCKTLEKFLDEHGISDSSYVFSFHLLHHIDFNKRKKLFAYIKKTKSTGIFIEPNPYNPFVLIQILTHPKMLVREEYQYLMLTKKRFRHELHRQGLETCMS